MNSDSQWLSRSSIILKRRPLQQTVKNERNRPAAEHASAGTKATSTRRARQSAASCLDIRLMLPYLVKPTRMLRGVDQGLPSQPRRHPGSMLENSYPRRFNDASRTDLDPDHGY